MAPRAAGRRIGLLLLVIGAAAWMTWLRPAGLGGPVSYVLVTGRSMEPTLAHGDLVALRDTDGYAVGDIVAFTLPRREPGEGPAVIHRIVGGNADDGFLLRGDNNAAPDAWRPNGEHVIGSLWLHVPGAGVPLQYVRDPFTMAALAAAVTVSLVLSAPSGHGGAHARRRATEASHASETEVISP